MAATVEVHKGGRLRLHVKDISNVNNTFKIPANFRIEFVYAIIITEIIEGTNLHGIEMKNSTPLSILKSSPHYISGPVGTFIDLSPRINRQLLAYSETSPADNEITISHYVVTNTTGSGYNTAVSSSWTARYKLIIGLESII